MNDDKFLVLLMVADSEPPIYFIRDAHTDDAGELEYFYNESTCPVNIVDADVVIQNGDTDPHGVFEFVEVVPKPDDWPFTGSLDYDRYREIFKELPPKREMRDVNTILDEVLVNVEKAKDLIESSTHPIPEETIKLISSLSDKTRETRDMFIRQTLLPAIS